MNKSELLEALRACRPALAQSDLIPVLTQYCFDGNRVFAYNEVLCIIAYIDIGFAGALPGDALYRVIDSFSSDDVFMERDDNAVVIKGKSNKSKVELPIASHRSFLYKDPKNADIKETHSISDTFITCLEFCLSSVPDQPYMPCMDGITISRKVGDMYSSDGVTVAYAYPDFSPGRDLLLPAAFCKQMITLGARDSGAVVLSVGDGFAMAKFEDRGITVFTKLSTEAEVDRFSRVVDKHSPDDPIGFEIPKQLSPCLERCSAVLSGDPIKVVSIGVDKSGFDVNVEAKLGKVHEQFQVDTGANEGTFSLDVELLRKILESADTMEFLDSCLAVVTTGVGIKLLAQKSAGED